MEEDVEYIKVTPDQLGYKDRGMMKWQGLILSDHADALKRMNQLDEQSPPAPKEKMSEEAISEILQLAFLNKEPITMQADIIRNGMFYRDLHCMVLGYTEDNIYFRLDNGRQIKCELHQIRHIAFMNPLEWYSKI